MQVVAQQQLQRMFACCERYLGGCAAVPEVHVVRVGRNRQPWVRQVGIDEKVMMARMRLLVASLDDGHTLDTEFDADRIADGFSVARCYEKHPGAIG